MWLSFFSAEPPNVSMKNVPYRSQTTREVLLVIIASVAMLGLGGHATAAFYINCAGCHTVPRNGMVIVNFQSTTNLGASLLER